MANLISRVWWRRFEYRLCLFDELISALNRGNNKHISFRMGTLRSCNIRRVHQESRPGPHEETTFGKAVVSRKIESNNDAGFNSSLSTALGISGLSGVSQIGMKRDSANFSKSSSAIGDTGRGTCWYSSNACWRWFRNSPYCFVIRSVERKTLSEIWQSAVFLETFGTNGMFLWILVTTLLSLSSNMVWRVAFRRPSTPCRRHQCKKPRKRIWEVNGLFEKRNAEGHSDNNNCSMPATGNFNRAIAVYAIAETCEKMRRKTTRLPDI